MTDIDMQILRNFIILGLFFVPILADELEFSLVKKGVSDNNTLLLIGGIQGDEPGGFMAANIVATEYRIKKGSLWVVPNLNFKSIIKNHRGFHGDMNRKFDKISQNDPDFTSVRRIQNLITDKNVTMVLHLHDGSGFYNEIYIDEMNNPKRWGNSSIIDQAKLNGAKYENLEQIAQNVIENINSKVLDKNHIYRLKNTKTADGDTNMLKSLTYFAIKNGKSAFANEASKTLNIAQRIYYHLLAIESYLNVAGIEFERNFELTPQNVKKIMEKDVEIFLFDERIFLQLKNPRPKIGYLPLPKGKIRFHSPNPLVAITSEKGDFLVHYGNNILTKLSPQFFEYSSLKPEITAQIDGKKQIINLGTKINAKNSIKISKMPNIRLNFIGFDSHFKDESGILVTKNNFLRAYSIDKNGKIFRAEFYEQKRGQKDKFVGMFLVEFE